MFALPPETKKYIFSNELLKIKYGNLIKPEEIGKFIRNHYLFFLIYEFSVVLLREFNATALKIIAYAFTE